MSTDLWDRRDRSCIACGAVVSDVDDCRGPANGERELGQFGTIVCGTCGAIFKSERDGTRRPLTKKERRALPSHRQAKGIREYQDKVVAGMWG